MQSEIFSGVIPALMTPCTPDRAPDFDALVRKARELVGAGMSAVVYCGSMGDWPLLSDAQRMEGVARLVAAGIKVVVGTGADQHGGGCGAGTARGRGRRAWVDGYSARVVARPFAQRRKRRISRRSWRQPPICQR